MTTIYSYFGDKMNLDGCHSHLHRARASVMNIVCLSIGVTKIAALMVPPLKGKLNDITFLVPLPKEFIPDLVVRIIKKAYKDTMNTAFETSVEGPLIDALAYIEELFLFFDFKGTHVSSSVEGKLSLVMGGNMVEVVLKYDYKCEGLTLLSTEPCAVPCCWAWLL